MAAKGSGLMLLLDKPKKGKKKPMDEDEEDTLEDEADDDLDLLGDLEDDVPEDLEEDEAEAPGGAFEALAETALGTSDPEKISALKECIKAYLDESGGDY